MKRKSDDLPGTNFEFLKRTFPDLIDSMEDGFFGEEPSKGPLVRKKHEERRYPTSGIMTFIRSWKPYFGQSDIRHLYFRWLCHFISLFCLLLS